MTLRKLFRFAVKAAPVVIAYGPELLRLVKVARGKGRYPDY